jgi:IclR family transcriptional regulator, KDG regulon repressor
MEKESNVSTAKRKTPILKSVDKAFDVLEHFCHDNPDFTLNELARKLRVSKGTVHRILITAQKRGFIEQNPETKKYQLGMKVFELGSVVAKRMDLRSEALPVLKKLSELTGETSYILVRSGDEAVGVERVEGHNYLRMLFLEVGKRMPLYIGAGPKVLLAYMDDQEIENIIDRGRIDKWTDYTITDPAKIRDDIKKIREAGYAISKEDVTVGAAAVGAPIRNASGKVIAAVSIAGASIRYQDEMLQSLIDVTRSAGMEISRRLGQVDKR